MDAVCGDEEGEEEELEGGEGGVGGDEEGGRGARLEDGEPEVFDKGCDCGHGGWWGNSAVGRLLEALGAGEQASKLRSVGT